MGKDRLIVINNPSVRGGGPSKLPPELPPNLIYWIRCETRVKPPTEENYYNEDNGDPLFKDEEL
jgi:hypothetical protein